MGIEDIRRITLHCTDCNASIEIQSSTIKGAYKAARSAAWAVSDKHDKYYCPNCAPNHTHVGCKGARRNVQTRIKTD